LIWCCDIYTVHDNMWVYLSSTKYMSIYTFIYKINWINYSFDSIMLLSQNNKYWVTSKNILLKNKIVGVVIYIYIYILYQVIASSVYFILYKKISNQLYLKKFILDAFKSGYQVGAIYTDF